MVNITEDMMKAIAHQQKDALAKWWAKNSTEEMRTKAKGKTIEGALKFVTSVARHIATGGCAMIADDDVYGLLVHYMDDEEEGAEVGKKSEAERKKEREEAERKRAEREREDAEREADRRNAESLVKITADDVLAERKEKEEERKARSAIKRTAEDAVKKAKADELKAKAESIFEQMSLF